MNLAARVLRAHVPTRIKRQKLNALFEATARAFGKNVPDHGHYSFVESLEKYAVFTRDEIRARQEAGVDLRDIREALYRHGYELGSELRERLGVRTRGEVISVGRSLYRAIGIDFRGKGGVEVEMSSCFFSRYYSEGVCRIMSSLDEGIAAGLSAGGTLTFSQRITEGKQVCSATLAIDGGAK